MSPPAPKASVILPAYLSHATITRSLESLQSQTFQDFETIVVDSSPDDRTADAVRASCAEVKLIRSDKPLRPHEARNRGAAEASGGVLAFTDPDCLAAPDWLALLVDWHDKGKRVVGGVIAPEAGWWNRTLHWIRLGWWLTGGGPGPHRELASANTSLARDVWLELGSYGSDYFSCDSELSWRARALGYEIWFDPRAAVTHVHPVTFTGLFRDRFARGRDFGLMRSESLKWPKSRSLGYMLATPILPLVMTLRAARYAGSAGRVPEWLLLTPLQALFHGVWCVGEATAHWSRLTR